MGISVSESQAIRAIDLKNQYMRANELPNSKRILQSNQLNRPKNYKFQQRALSAATNISNQNQKIQSQANYLLKSQHQTSKMQTTHANKKDALQDELIIRSSVRQNQPKSNTSTLRSKKIPINKKK